MAERFARVRYRTIIVLLTCALGLLYVGYQSVQGERGLLRWVERSAEVERTRAEVAALAEERRKLEREVSELRRKLAAGGGKAAGGPQAREVAGVTFAARVVEDLPPKDLKPMADDLKKQIGSGVVVLVAVNEGKASLVVAVTGCRGPTDSSTGDQTRAQSARPGAAERKAGPARARSRKPTWDQTRPTSTSSHPNACPIAKA